MSKRGEHCLAVLEGMQCPNSLPALPSFSCRRTSALNCMSQPAGAAPHPVSTTGRTALIFSINSGFCSSAFDDLNRSGHTLEAACSRDRHTRFGTLLEATPLKKGAHSWEVCRTCL